jgi:GrpB-like predicted nucleotidyltransferase (UPF0157 family)
MATVPSVLVQIHPYDPTWPDRFEAERACIAAALGSLALRTEHVGSTSVPGLAAKNTIDVVIEVPDSADEASYVPALEAAGYVFVLREPDWFEHRVLRREPRVANLHVFARGCTEIDQMTGFRDWLRANPDDRDLYERAKRELAAREWSVMQDYADAKTDIVTAIKRRAGLPCITT